MKREKWITKGFVFGMVLVVAALFQLGTSGAQPATKAIELSYNHFWPAENFVNKLFKGYATEIEERTNGQVKITVYPGGVLTKPNQIYEGVIKGISDIGTSDCLYTPGRFPLTEIIYLPWGPRSSWQGSHIVCDLYKNFRPKEFDDTKLLYFFTSSPTHFHTKKPVNKLEDFKGMKIRCTSGNAAIVEALGAIPVSIPISEAFMALQRGACDGIIAPYEALKGFRLAEVIKYTTEAYASLGPLFVVMNLDKWNSLSPEAKKIFEEVSEKWVDIMARGFDEADAVGKNFSLSLGNKIIILPPEELARWQERLRPVLDKGVAEIEAKGLPGRAAINEVFKLKEKYK
jgi:TRAP-type C4-dicarboxylate transport system substrate-binding protein